MFQLKSEVQFDMAHFLHGYDGKCANIHGHRYRLVAMFQSETLCAEGQARGMVADFHTIKAALKELAEEFDESVEIVKETLDYLKENNMISINENLDCFIPEVLDHTGSECYSAERMRRHRANKRVSHCDTDVTKSDSCVTGSDEEKELEKELEKNICSEPKAVSEPSGIKITLNDKSFYDVPAEKIVFWKEVYPAVDIDQELKKMTAWCDANPTRRKTRRGIEKFINSWLSREQDKGGKYRETRQEKPKTEFELPEYLKNLNQDPDPEIDKLWGG